MRNYIACVQPTVIDKAVGKTGLLVHERVFFNDHDDEGRERAIASALQSKSDISATCGPKDHAPRCAVWVASHKSLEQFPQIRGAYETDVR